MMHILENEHSHNGHVVTPLTPLHTHKKFTTTLRLPGEHPRHARRPLRRVRQAVSVEMVDNISPALFVGCAVVLAASASLMIFVLFALGRMALELIRSWIGG